MNSTEGSKSVANTTKETVKGQSGKISFVEEKSPEKVESQDWIMKTASVLIEHLNKFGACFIDDFLGEAKGVDILDEVLHLRDLHMFQVI